MTSSRLGGGAIAQLAPLAPLPVDPPLLRENITHKLASAVLVNLCTKCVALIRFKDRKANQTVQNMIICGC